MTTQIRWIQVGLFLTTAGTWAQNFAVAWLVYRLYDSAFLLGVVACLNQLPTLLIGRYAGRSVDLHLSRRFILVIQVLLAVQCLLLVVVARSWLSVEALVVLCLLQGVLFAFEMPAIQTFVAHMVVDPKSQGHVATWNSLAVNAGRFLGPALAGWLMSQFDEVACFAFNAASHLPLIVSLLLVRGWKRSVPVDDGLASPGEAGEGGAAVSRHIAGRSALREPLIAAAAMFGLTMPFLSYIPALTVIQLDGKAGVYSSMAVATGVGAALASVFAAGLKDFKRVPHLVPGAVIAGGLVLAVATLSTNAYLSGLLFALLGFCMNLTGTLTNAWLIQNAPDKWRGSIMSRYNMVSALYPVGSITLGVIALWFPVMRALLVAGVLCAVFVLVRRYVLPAGQWADGGRDGMALELEPQGQGQGSRH